mmetsp:Transcript_12661/g.30911  ORF Transcript_12661/g.30911 Transcript_12661/m.30911 type:complete len:347 (+) Transcript_12661:378-1418(+)|eukprot:CAMPEP_0181100846 /NCGR_PEP_ID=MMETSP1071-20121207/13419_1 /TAXON_ID=35127 /ORGANISM="Thalassiosira sp., Strain NH16" /LENGTH=346 /DNA_ID=CAMNT_0023183619 /DNA_START=283 /DNA_END=1323 /DNA_ORIENTATION=-
MIQASFPVGVSIGFFIGVSVCELSSWKILSTLSKPETSQIKVNDTVLYMGSKEEVENETSGSVLLFEDKREVFTKSEGSNEDSLQISLPENIANENILPYGYNIGDLMNMPSYLLDNGFPRSGWEYSLTSGREAAVSIPDSIIGIYGRLENFEKCYTLLVNNITQNRRPCAIFPIIRTLKQSVAVWGMMNAKKSGEVNARLGEDVLLVHIRSGDKGRIEKSYFSAIQSVSKLFKKTIVISGVHTDTRYGNISESKTTVHSDVASLQQVIRNLEFFEGSPDAHIFMMQHASHLLVHKGGFSALGALLNEGGKVYHTHLFEEAFNISLFENLRRSRNTTTDVPTSELH